jgi:hypothetical protein
VRDLPLLGRHTTAAPRVKKTSFHVLYRRGEKLFVFGLKKEKPSQYS